MSRLFSGIKSDFSSRINKTVTSYNISSVAVSGTDTIFVAASSDGTTVIAASFESGDVYTSTNSGATYTLRQTFFSASILYICCSSDGTKVFVPVNSDTIYYSSDSGVTFTATNISGQLWVSICCSSDGNLVYAVDQFNSYRSTNAGVNFTLVSSSGLPQSITCSLDGTKVYTIGTNGIYYSSNSGVSYTSISTLSNASRPTISCNNDATIVAAIDSGNLYVSVDAGVTFTNRTTAIAVNISTSGRLMAIYKSGGSIHISNDYGLSWTNTGLSTTSVINLIITTSETLLFYGNGTGAVNKTTLNMAPLNNLGNSSVTVGSTTRPSLSSVLVPSTIISMTTAAATTKASSLCVQGPPIAGTNHTITNTYALEVMNGTSQFNGPVAFASNTSSALVASGSGSINFSGCSGTFLTSTGNVTLGGNTSTVVLGSGTTPTTSLSFAAGSTGTFDLSNSTGSFKFTSGPSYLNARELTTTTALSATTGSHYIVVTSGTFTITLPGIQTSATNGIEYHVLNSGSGTITLSVANTGTERFNGGTSTTISMSQHDRTHVIAFTNVANSLYTWYNF